MKKFMFAIIVLAAMLAWAPTLQAAWVGNDIPIRTDVGEKSSQIENLIIDGASSFLKSYSDILLLLNESEIGLRDGFNLYQAQQLLDSAHGKLVFAKENYSRALDLIKGTQFEEAVLEKLKTFNYAGLTAARKLHPAAMKRVASFLSVGNVRGVYKKLVKDMEDILYRLREVREDCQKDILPGMEDLRTIFQEYSDVMLYGYYSSLVFSEIKK